jgi:hypothetical protein
MAMRLTKRTYFRPNRAYYERPNFALATDSILLPGNKAFLPGWVHSIGLEMSRLSVRLERS